MRLIGSAVLVALGFLAGTGSFAKELELPTAPLRQYYQAERERGAERSEALARALVLVSRHQPLAERLELLQRASLADPTWSAPHLERFVLELRQHDPASASLAARDAARCVFADAVQQSRLLQKLERGAHALLLATLVTLVVLMLGRSLFFVQHLAEAQRRGVFAGSLVVSVALLWCLWRSPFGAILLALLCLASFSSRKERRTLAALCFALAVGEIPLPWLQTHAMLLDPRSASARLAAAQHEGGDPRLEASLVRDVSHGRERELVLGLLARRRGDLAGAESHYSAALAADPNWAAPYVNLANVYFVRGDMHRAAAGYRKAQSLEPDNPFAHANLAQAYIRLLQFGEVDQELHRAAELDFDRITQQRAAWLHGQIPVLDVVLGPKELLRLAGDEGRAKPQRAEMLLEGWRGAGWDGLSPWKTATVLLGLTVLLLSRWRARSLAFECRTCRRVVCSHCAPRREGRAPMCPYCETPTPRFERNEAYEGVLTHRSRPRHQQAARLVDRMPRWIGTIFPGAADLTCGAPMAALWTLLLAWAALLTAHALVQAGGDRTSPWFVSANAQALRLAVVVFFLAYLQGLLRLRRSWRRLGNAHPAEGR